MTNLFACVRTPGAALAILLLLAGSLGAQDSHGQDERSLREAAFEVVFAKDEATVEKHLSGSAQQFLDQVDPDTRDRFLKNLMLAASAEAHGTAVRRMEGDRPIVRLESDEGQDISEISVERVAIADGKARVELDVNRSVGGKPAPEDASWLRHITFEARLEEGVWRLTSIAVRTPDESAVSLDGPELEQGVIAADEAAAVGNLRTLNTAEVTYFATYPEAGMACALATLSGPGTGTPDASHAELIDGALASGKKGGYVFTLSGCSGKPSFEYTITVVPAAPGKTGRRAFCTDQSAIIYYSDDGNGESCLKEKKPLE